MLISEEGYRAISGDLLVELRVNGEAQLDSRVKQHAVFEGGNAHGESTDSPAAMGCKVLLRCLPPGKDGTNNH
eukprot:Skav209334  [mRNA]  locus=scaffold241:73448:79033:- [translate_table: standard]